MMASKQDWQKIIVIAIALCCVFFIVNSLRCKPELPVEIAPAVNPLTVNPLTADLEEANEIIDQLVGFNNFLIRDLEECENGR